MTNQELVALIKKNPISAGCAVLCLALAAGIYFRSDDVPAQDALLVQKSAEGEKLAANIKNSKDLKDQFDTLVAANKEIEARLIRANQLGENAGYFYKLESDTGVKLVGAPNQNPQPGAKGKGMFVPVLFNVTVQGDMNQLLQFLHHLESGAHYARVLSSTCSLGGGGASSGKRDGPLSLQVTLELLGLP